MTLCTRCGADLPYFDPRDDRVTADLCDACSENFFAAMAREYPFGQCWQCGAAGREWTCQQGKVHVLFDHSEGGCSMWRDREPLGQDAYAVGFCDEGCRPANLDWAEGARPSRAFVAELAADELPF
jgi:hypothetical protein